jgi:hypothetical protein
VFEAQLTCENCQFVTESFFVGYYPPSDRADFVFQNLLDHEFRIVPCHAISLLAIL